MIETLIDEMDKMYLYQYQKQIQGFIDSPYYQMIQQAIISIKKNILPIYDKTLQQTIHGIFDLVFIYQNQVYVLDYKTDRISQNSAR